MRVRHEQIVDEVLVLNLGCRPATTTPFLGLVNIDRLGLGIPAVRQRHDNLFLRDQVFHTQVRMILNDFGAPLVAERVPYIFQLATNHVEK